MDDSIDAHNRCFQRACFAEDEMPVDLLGLRKSFAGNAVFWILVFCSAGLVYVVDKWVNVIYINIALKRSDLADAHCVQVQQNGKHLSLEKVGSVNVTSGLVASGFGLTALNSQEAVEASPPVDQALRLPVFTFKHHRFVYHPQLDMFVSVGLWKDIDWYQGKATGALGLTQEQHAQRLELFGKCLIDIREKSYMRLLLEEALNPFYVFQLASIAIWCAEEYYYYSAVIFAISLLSIAATLISTKRTMRKIRQMSAYTCSVTVVRDGKRAVVDSSDLVPGDIFELSGSQFKTVPCEALLLEGDCIVNESMLTGESVPESKLAITAVNSRVLQDINMSAHTFSSEVSRHMLFAGTHLVRVRGGRGTYCSSNSTSECAAGRGPATHATAMVLRTGFNTTKGMLVQSILFPKPTSFKFYRDAFRFIGVLALVALVGFVINTVNLHRLSVSASRIVQRAFDLITVAIPPALPACMSIGVAFAASRLGKKGIFTISPSRINVASKVAAVCFDKTGTLTEDGLDLLGICVLSKESEGELVELAPNVEDISEQSDHPLSVLHALATCHSLNLVDNLPVGDPLETKMLEFSKWTIDEDSDELEAASSNQKNAGVKPILVARPPSQMTLSSGDAITENVIGLPVVSRSSHKPVLVLRVFEFSSGLRRSSVVTLALDDPSSICAYVKGAPESIKDICRPETIPANFQSVLDGYTKSGRRVIALAGKQLADLGQSSSNSAVTQLARTSVENQLCFLGFLVFENKIKPETAAVLKELRDAKIRMMMCTGDNALTAVSVARECHLVSTGTRVFVPHFVSSGSNRSDSVFSSEKDSGIFKTNILGLAMPRVCWKDALGSNIELDPSTLEPFATNPLDAVAVRSAADLARSGCYCVAVTGDVFTHLFKQNSEHSDICKRILMRGAVYARMSPEQKADLIERLQEIGYIACFCGDGANDCAALKTADVGISLSEAEASVAAPFTSHTKDIRCVVELLKEGRCSIATSFGCFKFMALYSMIQFTSCCLLYVYNVNLSDGQYLFIDLFTILPIAVCMDRSKPYTRLVPRRPSASLTSKKVLTSLLGNVVLVIAFQVAVFFIVEAQPWYQKPRPDDPSDPDSVPNKCDLSTALFLFSLFQYLFAGIVFNIGPPYRQSAFRNYTYLAVVALLVAFDLWMLLAPVNGFYSLFSIEHTKVGWRFWILGMAVANFVACYVGERFIFPRIAIPLAKTLRLVRWGLLSTYSRLRGSDTNVLYSPFKSAADIEHGGNLYQVEDNWETAGLWSRLGYRRGRKEYKILLEKMAGGSSWH